MLSTLLATLLSGILSGMLAIVPAGQAPAEYKVGPGDVLQIELPDFPDYSRSAKVQTNGTITLKELRSLHVAGLTPLQIQDAVRKAYDDAKSLVNPSVNVTITEYGSQKVFVQGEVARPGDQVLKGPEMSVLRAIAAAGGFSAKAGATIDVRRKSPAGMRSLPPINRKDLGSGAVPDPALQDGDTIIVSAAPTFIINGYVMQSGEKIWEDGLTIERAIAMAGGLKPEGSKDRMSVRRKDPKTGKMVDVKDPNKDTVIQPDDIIEIKKRWTIEPVRPSLD